MSLLGRLGFRPSWAQGANGWEAIADAFVRSEVGKAKPDFAGLAKLLAKLQPEQRHNAWHKVGVALKEKGETRLASQAFVEAVFANPDANSPAWAGIDLPPGNPRTEQLRAQVSRYPRRPIGDDRSDTRRLAVELRQLLGSPGE